VTGVTEQMPPPCRLTLAWNEPPRCRGAPTTSAAAPRAALGTCAPSRRCCASARTASSCSRPRRVGSTAARSAVTRRAAPPRRRAQRTLRLLAARRRRRRIADPIRPGCTGGTAGPGRHGCLESADELERDRRQRPSGRGSEGEQRHAHPENGSHLPADHADFPADRVADLDPPSERHPPQLRACGLRRGPLA
jgi:hypothetical protein